MAGDDEQSDDALLMRFALGDASAARCLTDRLAPRIHAQAWRMLGDVSEADDVTQDAFVKLWQIAPKWKSKDAQISTWLYKVVGNLCVDQIRKRRRMAGGMDELSEIADQAPGADERLVSQARQKALTEALAELPERQRLSIALRHFEGLSNPQIAHILDVSVEAVESLLARGKRGLSERLASQRMALGFEEER